MSIGLSADELAALFPFHVGFDPALRIVQVGRAWRGICPEVEVGARFEELFRLVRPAMPLQFDLICAQAHSVFRLDCIPKKLPLRGQMHHARSSGRLLFLCAPWVTDLAELAAFGLSLSDFPPHEALVDLMFVLQTKNTALSDIQLLADRLAAQQLELRRANSLLRHSESQLRALVEGAADGIITIDEGGSIQAFNGAASRIFGYEPAEVIGRNVAVLVPPPHREAHDSYVQRYLTTREARIVGSSRQVEGQRKDGSLFPLELSVSEIEFEGRSLFTAIVRDLTAQAAAARALRDTEERFRRIVETSLDGVIGMDGQGIITLWNPQAEALFGWSRAESVGQSLAELIVPAQHREAHNRGVSHYLETGEGVLLNRRIELTALHREGHEFPVELAISPLPGGATVTFSAFVSDISERKRSEQNLATQYAVTRALADSASLDEAAPRLLQGVCEGFDWDWGAIWTVDAASHSLRCAATWARPDVPMRNMIAASRQVAFSPNRGLPSRVWQGSMPMWFEDVGMNEEFLRKDAARADGLHAAVMVPIQLGDIVPGVIEFFRRRKSPSDGEMLQTIAGFGSQFGQFIERKQAEADLAHARDAAEAASLSKSRFLATMSHEIRTPLNPIIGMTGLLLDHALPSDQRRLVEQIRQSGLLLLRRISDILDFSKIEAGRVELEEVDFEVNRLVAQGCDLFASLAGEGGLRLTHRVDPLVPRRIRGDPTRIQQVLSNLISNAVKFTPSGGVDVAVSRQVMPDGHSVVRFEVHDTGPGIPADKQASLFDAFTQADASTTRQYGGSGLGLAIAYELVTLMRGKIGVSSAAGKGSCFWFTVPLVSASVGKAEPEHGGAPTLVDGARQRQRPARILVVEDNPVNQEVVTLMLGRLGHRIDLAGDGVEGVAAFQAAPYDLVFMDCMMPNMDGFTATQQIRAIEGATRHTPIVAMTAYAVKGDRERCLAAGMDDYISKPVQFEGLIAVLDRWLGESREPAATAVPAPAAPEAPAEPTIDASALEKLRSLDVSLVDRLVGMFVDRAPPRVVEMEEASRNGDLAAVERIAHNMKSESGTLGAKRLSELCGELQTKARQGDAAAAAVLVRSVRTEFDLVLQEIGRYRSQ